jgi:CBS domain-containing protein
MVRADDIMTPAGWVLHPDETSARAYELFQANKDDCIPVVTRDKPYQLLGLVRRRDVLRMLLRGQIDSSEANGGGGSQH